MTLAFLMIGFALCVCLHADPLLVSDFETDPTTQGWTTSGPGASWTTAEHVSGQSSLLAQTDCWSSPLLTTAPLQWYRLSFQSKTPGTLDPAATGSIGYGMWSADFYDQDGNLLQSDQYSSIFQTAGWAANEFRIRAKAIAGPNGTLLPAFMRISFRPIGGQPLYIDDVLVETTTPEEVAQWADAWYAGLPALNYVPKNDAGARLPRTLQKLQQGGTVRIVFLGDSVQCDTGNTPLDAFLQREYPGSHVEVITSTGHGTGMQTLKALVPSYVLAYRPDLLILGGISNTDDMTNFQNVVDQVRADDAASGRTTEIMAVTKNWSPNVTAYFLSPLLQELDQNPSYDAYIPWDYRGHLLQWADGQGLEFLDMTGIAGAYIYGPAAAAGVGPPDSTGVPYSFWMRDHTHSSDNGKQILGRILEAYFAPVVSPGPTRLTAQAGSGQITLTWRPAVGATGYRVARALIGGGPYQPLVAVPGTSTVDTGLTDGTPYFYQVTATGTTGPASNEASATPQAPPLAPGGLTAGSHNGYVKLAWNAVPGAIGYDIVRAQAAGGPFLPVVSLQTTAESDTGLSNGTPYFYQVTAIGLGGQSPPATATVTPLGPPPVPSGLTAIPGNARVSLSWTAPAIPFGAGAPTSFTLLRSTVAGGPYTALSAVLTATSYLDTGLANGTAYYYVVCAVDPQGTSGDSPQASALPSSGAPAAPLHLSARPWPARITLNWSASANATRYTVYRAAQSDGPYAAVGSASSPGYTDPDLTNGTSYFYELTASGAPGEGPRTAPVSAVPMPMPAIPSSLTATGGSQFITLTWKPVAYASGYSIYRLSPTGYVKITPSPLTTAAFTDGGLTTGTAYSYEVSALNAIGESAQSGPVSAVPF